MYIWKYVYVIIIYVYEEKTNWYQKNTKKQIYDYVKIYTQMMCCANVCLHKINVYLISLEWCCQAGRCQDGSADT